jgi:hypothetical protein
MSALTRRLVLAALEAAALAAFLVGLALVLIVRK